MLAFASLIVTYCIISLLGKKFKFFKKKKKAMQWNAFLRPFLQFYITVLIAASTELVHPKFDHWFLKVNYACAALSIILIIYFFFKIFDKVILIGD